MSKKSFLIGTCILAGAGILSRFIGFFYRIFLSHTLGAAGMGIYQLVVPVQALLITVSAGGIQTAISRLSASAIALKKHRKAKDYFLIGTLFSFSVSCILSCVLYQNASFVSEELLKESQTFSLIKIISFTFPFSTLHICINAYYYAQKKTILPSILQLAEQFTRIISSYIFYLYLLSKNMPVTPLIAGTGALISEIMVVLTGIIVLKCNLKKSKFRIFQIEDFKTKTYELFTLAFPLTLNRILLTLLGSIEVIMIPQCLTLTGMNNSQALSIYGILSGMALPLILFPSTLTNSFAVMLMPSVTQLNTLGYHKRLRHVIVNVYKYIFSLGIIFAVLFFWFGNFTGNLLFHNVTAGIYIRTLAFVCPFLYLNTTLSSILHGLGKMGTNLFHNSVSICIRIFFVIYMIPRTGIDGYLYGVILSEFTKTFLHSLSLYRFCIKN